MSKYSPRVISRNPSVKPLRMLKEVGKNNVYPLGKFPLRVAINFGLRTPTCLKSVKEVEDSNGIVLNHPSVILNASDKLQFKRIMQRSFIPTPIFQDCEEVINGGSLLNMQYPLVAKLKRGSGGKGMVVINTPKELDEFYKVNSSGVLRNYFIEEIFQPRMSRNYEFRIAASPWLLSFVHTYVDITDQKNTETSTGAFCILRKRMKQEAVKDGSFGRNIALGNSYFTKDLGLPKACDLEEGIDMVQRALVACGLDFGAADVIYDSKKKIWTILELNTAPSMGSSEEGYTLNQWKQALPKIINEKLAI